GWRHGALHHQRDRLDRGEQRVARHAGGGLEVVGLTGRGDEVGADGARDAGDNDAFVEAVLDPRDDADVIGVPCHQDVRRYLRAVERRLHDVHEHVQVGAALDAVLPLAHEAPHGDVARGDARDVERPAHPLRVLAEVGVREGDRDAAVFARLVDEGGDVWFDLVDVEVAVADVLEVDEEADLTGADGALAAVHLRLLSLSSICIWANPTTAPHHGMAPPAPGAQTDQGTGGRPLGPRLQRLHISPLRTRYNSVEGRRIKPAKERGLWSRWLQRRKRSY